VFTLTSGDHIDTVDLSRREVYTAPAPVCGRWGWLCGLLGCPLRLPPVERVKVVRRDGEPWMFWDGSN
jgi:hypothetical protein